MLTTNFKRRKGWLVSVNGIPTKGIDHLRKLRIPPAWTDVAVDPAPGAIILATGKDVKGRKQKLYHPDHIADAKAGKFVRVRALLEEWADIKAVIEMDIEHGPTAIIREAALVAYLTYETGIRPGSNTDTLADKKAYGATTLQLRHVKPCERGVRLKFTGKKGVSQNVLVTNPRLVQELIRRKAATTSYTTLLFKCSSSTLNKYFKTLGSGEWTPKDFRTAVGTSLALKLIGNRQRFPKTKTKRKRVVNAALDQVARKLGNTRAVSRSAYVDPIIIEQFFPPVQD